VLVLLLVAGAFAVAVFGPPVILRLDLGPSVGDLSTAERAASLNEIRAMVFQGIGAFVVLLGAYTAWRQLQQNARAADEQAELQRQTRLTDRYGQAVEHLAHDNQAIRIGAIYALNRIAHESEAERAGVITMLSSYIRTRAPWPPPAGVADVTRPTRLPLRSRAQDIQAALSVLTRWIDDSQDLPEWLTADLAHTDLENGNLRGRCLWRVRFRGANLAGANLSETDLRGTDLRETVLTGADFTGARADDTTWWSDDVDPATLLT
jgi:hypothetical protein